MSFFDNLIGGFFLIVSVFGVYSLIRNRPELFSATYLSKAMTTMGFLTLGLVGFVTLLFYSLPSHTGIASTDQETSYKSASVKETPATQSSQLYDRSV